MKRNHASYGAVAVLGITALIVTGCGSSHSSGSAATSSAKAVTSGEPIKIGVLQDLSGAGKAFSEQAVLGLKTAVQALDAGQLTDYSPSSSKPGIMGRPVSLSFEDAQSDPNTALTKARALTSSGVSALILDVTSPEILQVKTACSEAQVVCIAPFGSASSIVQPPDNGYIYTMATTFNQQAAALAAAIKDMNSTRVAIVQDPAGNTKIQADTISATLKSSGLTVVDTEVVQSGALDLSPQMAQLKNANPQAVINLVNPAADTVTFLRAFQQAGIKAQVFGLGGIVNSPEVWKLAGDSINGMLAVDVQSPDNDHNAKFRSIFAAAQGKNAPYLSVHAENLTALMVLKAAMESAASTDGPKVNAALQQTSGFPAAIGQRGYTINWTATDHNGAKDNGDVILQFSGGSPSKLWSKYQPSAS